jgi:hypothetical protein
VQAIYEAAARWFRPAVLLGAGLGLRQAEASDLTVDVIEVQVSGGASSRSQPLSRD